jgi:hypothetical protein
VTNPTIIETIARAIELRIDDIPMVDASQGYIREVRSRWLAEEVMTSLDIRGFAIVPVEPTDAMIDAGYNSEDCDGWSGPTSCWERMIQAGKVKP